ncbi:MAG: hypothetical protein V7L25_25920 [Nostoc sp.]
MFQPFQHADNVRNISGTALGLVIAKNCVEAQEGKIVINSQIRVGTTFNN